MIFTNFGHEVTGFKDAPKLKSLTGANAMISSLAVPPMNKKFVQRHVESGALFYRIITTSELMNITEQELLLGLGKMIEIGCHTWQCILMLDSSHTILDYDKSIFKMDSWSEHGGITHHTFGYPAEQCLVRREPKFLENAEKHATILMPRLGAHSDLEVSKNWTLTLATFPMVGLKGAQTIRELINKSNLGDDLLTAIIYLTDDKEYRKSDGQWRDIRRKAREWLGLPDGFDIDLKFSGTNITEVKD